MIRDYFINAAVLVSFVSVIYLAFRNSGLSPSLPIRKRLLSGTIWGMLGVVLIIFSIHLPNHLLIDFRFVAIILSAITGGWVSCAISGLILPVFRILIFGVHESSVKVIIIMLILTVLYCIIAELRIKKQWKWAYSVAVTEVIIPLSLTFLIENSVLRNQVIIYFCISLSLVSILIYFYVDYLETLTESYRILKREARKDFLTGLNNLRQFDAVYNQVVDSIKTTEGRISLLYIDIDDFKKVNDTYGHKEGDIVLKKLGETLMNICRSIDIVSRNGGEEFSVILMDCPFDMAMEIAERIRKKVESTPIELSTRAKIRMTVSVGVASYPEPIKDLDTLKEKADQALYKAKRTGRNKVAPALH